jgi:hypothetical protein
VVEKNQNGLIREAFKNGWGRYRKANYVEQKGETGFSEKKDPDRVKAYSVKKRSTTGPS